GHRGINVPVIDHATGRVAVTAQNHGFALEGEAGEQVDTPFGTSEVSHTCANDGVVEGIKLVDGRAFSVQYHPEAAAGPHAAEYLFDQIVDLMAGVDHGCFLRLATALVHIFTACRVQTRPLAAKSAGGAGNAAAHRPQP